MLDISIFQSSWLGLDVYLLKSRLQRCDAHQPPTYQVGCRCTPGMIPVEVGLEDFIPCLGGNGGTHRYHIIPTAQSCASQQLEGSFVLLGLIEGIQQKLCPIHAAGHTSALHILGCPLYPVLRHQSECQGEHTAVLRAMAGALTVHIGSSLLVPKQTVDTLCRTFCHLTETQAVLLVTQCPSYLAHHAQGIIMIGIDHRIDITHLVSVGFPL